MAQNKALAPLKNLPDAAEYQRLADKATEIASHGNAHNTMRLYTHDFKRFESFCESMELDSMPADGVAVALFLTWEMDHLLPKKVSVSTLERRLSAIHYFHRLHQLPSPRDAFVVQSLIRGARRVTGRKTKPKTALLDADIKRVVGSIKTNTLQGLRDRALLLIGFSGAMRRSELAVLELEDFNYQPEGALVTIGKSKTDQESVGETIAILFGQEHCPLEALAQWLAASGIDKGPIFRRVFNGGKIGTDAISDKHVARTVKKYTGLVDLPGDFSGHSLRRGFITSAVDAKASLLKVASQSRHKSLDMVRRYVDERDKFNDHAGADLLKD